MPRVATSARSTSGSRSDTGSSRASSRACSTATRAAPRPGTVPGIDGVGPMILELATTALDVMTGRRAAAGYGLRRAMALLRAALDARSSTVRSSSSLSRAGSMPGSAQPARSQPCSRPAPTELVATFDGEALIDQRARRPVARIVNGVTERLTWPMLELRSGHDLAGTDILYLVGPEPDFKWRSFVSAVVDLSRELGVRMAVGLGAFPAPAPHTRPIKLAATAPEESSAVSAGIGVVQGAIEVPAGVWGALELAFGAAGIPAVGLWARVPHYVTGMAFAPASAALVEGLATLAGLKLDTSQLITRGRRVARQVDELITKSSEHLELVRQLERNLDATEGNPLDLGQIPTADELGPSSSATCAGNGVTETVSRDRDRDADSGEDGEHGEHGEHGDDLGDDLGNDLGRRPRGRRLRRLRPRAAWTRSPGTGAWLLFRRLVYGPYT